MSRRAKARDPVREAKHADAYAEPRSLRDMTEDDFDEALGVSSECCYCAGSGLELDGVRCACCGANRESMNG